MLCYAMLDWIGWIGWIRWMDMDGWKWMEMDMEMDWGGGALDR